MFVNWRWIVVTFDDDDTTTRGVNTTEGRSVTIPTEVTTTPLGQRRSDGYIF